MYITYYGTFYSFLAQHDNSPLDLSLRQLWSLIKGTLYTQLVSISANKTLFVDKLQRMNLVTKWGKIKSSACEYSSQQ